MIRDKNGRAIKAGDYIVYGHALDRSAALRFGKVLLVSFEDTRVPIIIVIGVADGYLNHPPKLLSRKSHLLYPERIIVLDRDDINPTARALLDSYVEEP